MPLPDNEYRIWVEGPPKSSQRKAKMARPSRARAAAPETGVVLELVPVRRSEPPTMPLHGVDFSGARETRGRNGKIWIASWYPDREFVELKSGGDDPGFDRVGLAGKIIESGGTWVIDFPFGPAAAVAAEAAWTKWHDYLAWCGSNPAPTALRDQLRQVLQGAGVPWSTTRKIDQRLGTTWFPFFEQLVPPDDHGRPRCPRPTRPGRQRQDAHPPVSRPCCGEWRAERRHRGVPRAHTYDPRPCSDWLQAPDPPGAGIARADRERSSRTRSPDLRRGRKDGDQGRRGRRRRCARSAPCSARREPPHGRRVGGGRA